MSNETFRDGTKSNQHVIAWQVKTMSMCENFPLKENFSKQVLVGAPGQLGASTITKRPLPGFRQDFNYLVKPYGVLYGP